jgi:oxygen-independent coproporphyrinogen-3 oxidase
LAVAKTGWAVYWGIEMTMICNFKQPIPLALYIHLPWCVKKCPYCDFNSHEIVRQSLQEEDYIDALIKDLEWQLPQMWGRSIISVFIGGGTPSLFSVAAMDRLLSSLRARLNLHSEIEITLEANPGTVDAEKFIGYREIGINRISIGVQTFSDVNLKSLGRIHNGKDAMLAVEKAKNAGFENINIDLMFGLPGQNINEAINDLELGIGMNPSHISWYQLTIEPNTVFYAKPPVLPDEDYIWEIQQQGQKLLKESHYNQYEISAYENDNHQCKHNLNYWQFGDYLGIGAGSHSKLTDVANGVISRHIRHRIPERYINLAGTQDVITKSRALKTNELPLEFMMNAMRLSDGVKSSLFFDHTGIPVSCMKQTLLNAEDRGLIQWNIEKIKPTETGQRYLNDLLQMFMHSDDYKSVINN